ncbi:DNA-directed RNA polymerase I subunit RPA43 [Polistes fuscatus]|uniref:DNA-directed RNA polymerase I subunit RPA43 n=1 Tax=Polistes fuscatus TaxID=30207 RepID=UPI001CA8D89A|nr:DNA-directed RNA polymerase I subunit RPA43 [Polistes fuscatus]XP_043504503.1 DNA-directed RNA polymerase I subunit RPA43 [Polistes fuscatus]
MKFNSYTGITWSLLELEGLLEDENSQVHYERMNKHLGLHPFHLNDLSAALNEILSSGLNTYDTELQGFLLAYKNPKLLTTYGDLFYDSYYIHVNIEADFYVFRPQVGNLLKGIVHKKGVNYIGVLMHKTFNVSILRPENAEKWPGNMVNIGQEVRFTVTHLDFNSRLPFIRGVFNQADYLQGCKLPLHKTSNGSFYEANESDDTDSSSVVKRKSLNKKKRKSKEINKQVFSEEHVTNLKRSFSSEDTTNEYNEKRSKKKLKKSEESTNETEKEKKHFDISYHDADYLNDDETSIKKKKKRDKSLKRKSAEVVSEIADSEFDYSNVKVKLEKNISNSESESNVHVKKSKKHSKKSKYAIDESLNGSVYSEVQELENENHYDNEFSTPIKSEKLPKLNNIKEESTNHKRKSSNKRIKKSLSNSESEFSDNVTIKMEKSSKSENTQGSSSKEQKIKVKSEKSTFNNETDGKISSKKKHKRKRATTPEVEDYELVPIKKEKLGNYEVSPSKKSSKKKNFNNDNYDSFNEESEIKHENITKKSHKKSKVNDSSIELGETQIKTEKHRIKNEFIKQDVEYLFSNEPTHSKSRKKRSKHEVNNEDVKPFKNSELDNSISYENDIYSSPKNCSKKFQEENFVFSPSNVRIKIERSSSFED